MHGFGEGTVGQGYENYIFAYLHNIFFAARMNISG